MTDNVTLNAGTGGDTIRTLDRAGVETQVVALDVGGAGAESLVTAGNPLPVTASALPLPSGAATAARQDTGNTTLGSILTALGSPLQAGGSVSISGTVPVSGPLTDAQLRAAAVPVSGTFWQATQPVSGTITANAGTGTFAVSAASLPLPTGAATQTTLASIDTDIGALADSAYAGSGNASVIAALKGVYNLLAAALPAGSNTIGTVNLGTLGGAATETTLAALNTKTPAVGQTTMSGSRPVVIASDQSTLAVNQAGVSTTGSLGALNATVALSLSGASGFAVDLRGTFTATVTFQGTIDGTNWFTLAVIPAGSGANVASVTTATAAGAWVGNANGLQQVRAIATAYTSGTVTVVLRAMQAVGIVLNVPGGQTTQAVSGTVTANIGTGSIAAGTNAIGDVGIQYRASATGGASIFSLLSPATPAATSVKASAGRLLGMSLVNTAAALRSVKFWNTASGSVTLGATAAIFEVDLAAGQRVDFNLPGGIGFATAITVAVTGAKGLTDNTGALGASDVSGVLFFA